MKKFNISVLIVLLYSSCSKETTAEQEFWNWFESNNSQYFKNADQIVDNQRLLTDLTARLQKINENLVFEFSAVRDDGKREFVISADGIQEGFPAVTKLVDEAPELDNWKVIAFRQRVSGDDLGIELQGFKVTYDDIFFKHSIHNQKVGMILYIRNYEGKNHQQGAIYVLLDALLGEYDAINKIEWVEWKNLNQSEGQDVLPFIELRTIIDSIE